MADGNSSNKYIPFDESTYEWTKADAKDLWGDGQTGASVNGEDGSDQSYGPMNKSAGAYSDAGKYLRKNTKNYDSFKYFLEGIDATDQNLDQMTPYIQGISRLYFHKTPYFMHHLFPKLTDNFRSYLETGFKSISGIGDLQAQEATIEGGWANQKLDNISMVTDDTTQVEIALYEQTGSPVREFLETWLTGVRDPRSGVAHYHGAVMTPENEDGVPYGEKNHTGEFIYVALDPTAEYIEYACLLAHVWPKNVQKSHLNYQSGERAPAEMQCTFSCIKYEGKYINDIAAFYIAHSNLVYNYLDFNPYASDINPYADKETRTDGKKSGEAFSTYMQKTTRHAGSVTEGFD